MADVRIYVSIVMVHISVYVRKEDLDCLITTTPVQVSRETLPH